MTFDRPRDDADAAIFAEASTWLVEFRAGDVDAEARRRFNAWLRKSPEHIRAYMEVAALWGDIPTLAAGMEVDIDAVVAHARLQGNVMPLGASRVPGTVEAHLPEDVTSSPAARRGISSTRKRLALAASFAVAALVGIFVTLWQIDRGSTYTTTVGEQRSITLEDGSVVDLGARSRMRVRMASTRRDVELIAGQALFRVAPDKARPFVVASSNARVQAVGTQFDVHRRSTGTTVTVIEGRVAVQSEQRSTASRAGTSEPAPLFVEAGEQVTVRATLAQVPGEATGAEASRPRAVDTAAVAAWTDRTLSFENAPLSDVVEEFNRYNEKQMVLTDPTLEALRISGVFSATKPISLLNFLGAQMKLDVEAGGREIRISSNTAPNAPSQ
jgi:transmembrane sensor